jgi:hypothetical protein
MRTLSLDEKISIKGKLARKGVLPCILVQLDIKDAMRLHWACYGTPAAMHSTPKLWHRRTPRPGLMH